MPKLLKSDTFTKFNNGILDQLLADKNLNQLEIKAILLVVRLTLGTRQRFCQLKKADFVMVNIDPKIASKILQQCLDKRWIYFTRQPNGKFDFSISSQRFRIDKQKEIQDPRLYTIIGKQLRKSHLKKHLDEGRFTNKMMVVKNQTFHQTR